MFWAWLSDLMVVSGNNMAVLNDVTAYWANIWSHHYNDTLFIRYLYLLDVEHRLARRIEMEMAV